MAFYGGYDGSCGRGHRNTLDILRRLAPGSAVSVWFDDSGFKTTFSQFFVDDQVAFSGGALDGGLTYVKATDIRALKVGH